MEDEVVVEVEEEAVRLQQLLGPLLTVGLEQRGHALPRLARVGARVRVVAEAEAEAAAAAEAAATASNRRVAWQRRGTPAPTRQLTLT